MLSQIFETNVNGEHKFACQCGHAYKHKHHLYHHLKYLCGKEKKFICTLCPYKARQKCSLKLHIIEKHS